MNNLKKLLKKEDIDSNNILHLLVSENKYNKVSKILNKTNVEQHKQIINNRNNEGNTPLHLAVKNRNNKMIGLLLNYGANKNIINGNGKRIDIFNVSGGAYKINNTKFNREKYNMEKKKRRKSIDKFKNKVKDTLKNKIKETTNKIKDGIKNEINETTNKIKDGIKHEINETIDSINKPSSKKVYNGKRYI